MAVRMARGALSYLKQSDGNLCLQLRTGDYEQAVAGLKAAVRGISEIPSADEPDGPAVSYISEPLRLPDGPALMLDLADEPVRVLRQVADLLMAEAEAAGVADGELGPPKKRADHPFWGENSAEVPGAFYPQLLLRAQKVKSGPSIPPEWVDPVVEWLLDGVSTTAEMWVALGIVPFQIPARAAPSLLNPPAAENLEFMVGDGVMRRLRFSALSWDAVLSFAGPGMDGMEAIAAVGDLQALARKLAPFLDYSALDYRCMGNYGEPGIRHGISASMARGLAPSFPRFLIPEVFCWQILSPEHVCLLGEPPPGAGRLAGDRFEVPFGDLALWDEGSTTHAELRRLALAALDPLLHDSLPHMIGVKRNQNDWGTLDQIQARIEQGLPDGVWASPLVYDCRGLDRPIQVRVDHRLKSISLCPVGREAVALARRIAGSFAGEVSERPAVD